MFHPCAGLILTFSVQFQFQYRAAEASTQFSSVTQWYLTFCYLIDCSTPGFPVHHQVPGLAQTHVHRVMSSKHLFICCPLLLPSIFPSIRVFSSESVLCIRWPKYGSFSFSISPSNEYSRLISFRIDWFDLLADSQESSPTPQFKSINSLARINSSLCSNSHVHT